LDKATSREQKITITASSGLSKDEVDRMVRDSQAHAEEDRKRKEEVEARNRSDQMIYSVEKTLKEHRDKIGEAEAKNVESALEEARKVKDDPLNKVVDSYYIWTDGVLGEFMKLVDDQTLLVVCSDHGFQGVAHMPDGGVRLGIHMHRRYGMIGMVGRNVRKGARLSDAQVLDVTPTLLYALGYPVARDMDGRVLTEAFRPGFLESNPLQFISTYESGSRGAGRPIRSPVDDKVKQKLKALGYIQ
jgi:predicted AlkP superfamily phosphohydrolase/phosphomutase